MKIVKLILIGFVFIILSIGFNGCGSSSEDDNNEPEIITYGTIISTKTNRVWLDRNLGASIVCTEINDANCFGDYYQWGRYADGHEKQDSLTVNTLATTITPEHDNFIINNSNDTSLDWTTTDNDGSIRKLNWNPCPSSFRVPTYDEIKDEMILNRDDALNKLKVPAAGSRSANDGTSKDFDITTFWSSNVRIWGSSTTAVVASYTDATIYMYVENFASGHPVRCIQDNTLPTAISQNITVEQNSVDNIITLTGNDTNELNLNYTIISNPLNGVLNGVAPNLTYTPNNEYIGNDSFTFNVNNGTQTSTIAIVNITVSNIEDTNDDTDNDDNDGSNDENDENDENDGNDGSNDDENDGNDDSNDENDGDDGSNDEDDNNAVSDDLWDIHVEFVGRFLNRTWDWTSVKIASIDDEIIRDFSVSYPYPHIGSYGEHILIDTSHYSVDEDSDGLIFSYFTENYGNLFYKGFCINTDFIEELLYDHGDSGVGCYREDYTPSWDQINTALNEDQATAFTNHQAFTLEDTGRWVNDSGFSSLSVTFTPVH